MFESGESGFIFPFRYVWFAEADEIPSAEVLFSVPKKFHKRANKRNLLRRRTKEAYRLQKLLLHNGRPVNLDLALIYSSKEELSYKTISNASGGFWKRSRSIFKRICALPLIALVKLYQLCISPFTPPSCPVYADLLAIRAGSPAQTRSAERLVAHPATAVALSPVGRQRIRSGALKWSGAQK